MWTRLALVALISSTAAVIAEAGGPEASASFSKPIVREERTVEVQGASETWRLEWVKPPGPVCPPDDAGWFTCPCHGFEFGEEGELDLVRVRSGDETDRLHLTPLFDRIETPPPAWERKHAALRGRPVLASDFDAWEKAELARSSSFEDSVMKRAPVSVLELRDFNRDGWATEFILQISNLPCGKRESVLVGISPKRPRLHVFGSVEHPDQPLVLFVELWEALHVSNGSLRTVSWTCGDHASEVQQEITLTVDKLGIHAVRENFSCDEPPKEHGRLLSREIL